MPRQQMDRRLSASGCLKARHFQAVGLLCVAKQTSVDFPPVENRKQGGLDMRIGYFLVLAAGLAGLPGAASAQLPTQKVLTIDVAQAMAQEAMLQCRAEGYKVTVTVVDAGNALKALLRDDGAGLASLEIGLQKTNTVMHWGRPSGPPAFAPAGTPPPALLPNSTYAKGGLPIKVGDQVIGAISVSGAHDGEKDAACAQAGLAKVADKLK
jgi:uncharacterized protein GlcG (DUF336 family)